jgi:hypothetical protein
MAGRGGKRAGAGRKPTVEHQRAKKRREETIKIVDSAEVSPLEVMLEAMLEARAKKDTKAAAGYAQMAAPYCHPRLATVNANNQVAGSLTLNLVNEFPDE